MQIVCEQCGHVAAPAAVWTSGQKTRLECASCGHLNLLDVPTSAAGDAAPAVVAAEVASSAPWQGEATHSETVPPFQCPKCGMRQAEDESCRRCGLVFANVEPGREPWLPTPPEEPEAIEALREAESLWVRALETNTSEAHDRFVQHCLAHGLDDHAARRYRFHVADWPEDTIAADHLERMVELGRTRLTARLESEREDLQRQLFTARKALLVVVFVVGIGLAFLFFWMYPNLLG